MSAASRANLGDLDLICFSLEPWDEVWRRNQLLADKLLELRPTMRLLFAELPVDMTWSIITERRIPNVPRLRTVGSTGRLWAMSPRKWLPRRISPNQDRSLGRQVLAAGHRLGLRNPVLWINDSSYADTAIKTGWPTVYDVTDDWLLAEYPDREQQRQLRNDQLLLERADEVVVCSRALAESRGTSRHVHLIPNAADVDHLRRMQSRPADLPAGRFVLYQGSLSEGRLDIDLCVDLGRRLAGQVSVVMVGPNSMSDGATNRLSDAGVMMLGARPYGNLPGYLQHADVLVVPHQVTPFTESLDPIKAHEFAAIGRPAVSTPVAGFRELGTPVVAVEAADFVDRVIETLAADTLPPGPGPLTSTPPTWTDRATEFLDVLKTAASNNLRR